MQAEAASAIDLPEVHERMKAAADVARLPLRGGLIGGAAGGVLGQGTGNSLDFQDHRLYMPGDDPRHINWQAFARTGSYTMKLYREEISPRVDLVIDGSASMFFEEAKARRVWELAYFCVESALRLGAAVKCFETSAALPREVLLERLLGHAWHPAEADDADAAKPPRWERIPFRQSSLRVVISDLLFAAEPAPLLAALTSGKGRVLILAPCCKSESSPDWTGNLEFEDCESLRRDKRRVESSVLQRYLQAYRSHFEAWREACGRRQASIARVPAEGDFISALRVDAIPSGAVEI